MNEPGGRLVLVTGAGRSGTSTVAGALHHLGLHVPQPVLEANESNPMGFFEPVWSLRFHKRLMRRAVIEQTDGRPGAADQMAAAVTDADRAGLQEWLRGLRSHADQVVVKDPRSVWLPALWEESAIEVGLTTGFLTMVRHPAEVLGSRATYYRSNRPGMSDRQFALMNLCGWVNGNLTVERRTRGRARVLLTYDGLVADWRAGMTTVRDTFDLRLGDDLDPGHRHPVDDFVNPSLRRHRPGWDGLDVPADLQQLAEGVHTAMCALAASRGARDPQAESDLDRLGDDYAAMIDTAEALAHDAQVSAARRARRAALAEERPKVRAAQRRASELEQALARRPVDRLRSVLGRLRDGARRRTAPRRAAG